MCVPKADCLALSTFAAMATQSTGSLLRRGERGGSAAGGRVSPGVI